MTFGNTLEDNDQASATSAFTNNGDFLIVGVDETANSVTGVSYNGAAMTQIGTVLTHTAYARFVTLWGLAGATNDGSPHNIIISGGANWIIFALSVDGVDQTTPYTGLNTASGTGASPTIAVTTTVDNAYVLAMGLIQTGVTPGANTTMVIDGTGTSDFYFLRSTNAVSPAGSFTINTNSTAGEYDIFAIGINPPGSTAPVIRSSLLLSI